MLDKMYLFMKKGENRDFYNLKELNKFLLANNYNEYVDTDEQLTVISAYPDEYAAIYVDDPLFFYDLFKYGYTDGKNLTYIEWDGVSIIIDDVKPAAYLLEKDKHRYKSKELSITIESTNTGYFKRRIRINGKKVSISTLVKSTEV